MTGLRPTSGSWGPWRLSDDRTELVHQHWDYPVDLTRMTSSAEALDWIMQVAGRSWQDDVSLAGFVRALNDLLAPQANLCSFGRDRRISRRRVQRLIRDWMTSLD